MSLNHGYSYREQVSAETAGVPVLPYLASRHPHSGLDAWQERLARGELELDGDVLRDNVVLRAGQTLVWHRPPWNEPDVPRHFSVLHEDATILAVVKPRGLPTLPAGGYLEGTLLALVRDRYPGASPLHRLGRHSSGLVLFARTAPAAALLARAWRLREVEKRYRALGQAVATWERQVIDTPIGPVPHPALGTVNAASPAGKSAHSVAYVVERRADATLFDVDITTGRPHQVRIHLAWTGHPLVGDPLYAPGGMPRADRPGLPGDGGYLLHASRLRFVHPISNQPIELNAEAPPDLRVAGESSSIEP
jgi:23S rRNA pseudouridine1911/1915/1917 synthase